MNGTITRKRRRRRGKLVFVRNRSDNPRSAELNPEATRSTDQTLTEISLKSANSNNNAAILREREKANDRLAHIQSSLTAMQKGVLIRVSDGVEPGDSLRDIAQKADLHAPQISRAFDAAKKADRQQIFKLACREKRPPTARYRPYNPRVVPMETIMMPHQGPTLYTITVPDRPIGTAPVMSKMPSPETPLVPDLLGLQSQSQSAQTKSTACSGPEPKPQVVLSLSAPDARSLTPSLKMGLEFGKLKQLFYSCFQWFKTKLTALTGLKHPISRDESIRAKSPGT